MHSMGAAEEWLDRVADALGLTPERFEQRKEFLGLDAAACASLRALSEVLSPTHRAAVDEFSAQLGLFDETAAVLGRSSSLSGLKRKQEQHFRSLTEGPYDWRYVTDRLQVGVTHQRVGLAPSLYTGSYAKYLGIRLPDVWDASGGDAERFLPTLDALLKAVFLDLTLVLEAYFGADRTALAQSDARMQRAKRAAQFSIIEWDTRNDQVTAPLEDLRVLGIEHKGELVTINKLLEAVHPGDRRQLASALARVRTEGRDFRLEFRRMLGDGNVRWLEGVGAAVARVGRGDRQGIVVVRDITDRKDAEDRLAASDRRFWTLMDRIGDAIVVTDRRGMATECNSRFLELAARTREEVVAKEIPEFHAAQERAQIGALFPEVRSHGALLREGNLERADGGLIPVELSMNPVRWSGEDLVLLIYRDLTERRRAEGEALKLSRALDQAADAITITDALGRIEYVNPSFERLTGYTASGGTGRPTVCGAVRAP